MTGDQTGSRRRPAEPTCFDDANLMREIAQLFLRGRARRQAQLAREQQQGNDGEVQ